MAAADTCWTVVRAAAQGEPRATRAFAETYLSVVRAFFVRRWRGRAGLGSVDDAVQEVFLELFRSGGALARLDPTRAESFKSFLFGVASNVALRHEERAAVSQRRRVDAPSGLAEVPAREQSLSQQFDLAWARRMVANAAARQRAWAASAGEEALRRVEILELRFRDGLAVRQIAQRLGVPAERVHREYAKAREEFRQALRAELALHCSGGADIQREYQNLLAVLA
jgi:RNA polymerase sigma-70 factor (ECF subfamily)